jgi:hypothetical protein
LTTLAFEVGDAAGFLALIMVGASSTFMLVRSRVLKVTRNLAAVRAAHVTISVLAGVFMIVHVSLLFLPPTTTAVDLGYLSVGVAAVVWLTGTAFLERLRDSLFFHSTLATVLVGLIMVHAATSSLEMPSLLSQGMLATTVMIMLANAAYQYRRAFARPSLGAASG